MGNALKTMFANARKVGESAPVATVYSTSPEFRQAIRDIKEAPIPAMPTTLEGKKAAAMAALASLGKDDGMDMDDYAALHLRTRPLDETPHAPFDLNIEGEPHRVRQIGKKLMLVYLGTDGEVPVRPLVEGELESFWAKRIIK